MNTSLVRSVIHIPVENPKLDSTWFNTNRTFVSWRGNELSKEPKRFKMRIKSRFNVYK